MGKDVNLELEDTVQFRTRKEVSVHKYVFCKGFSY